MLPVSGENALIMDVKRWKYVPFESFPDTIALNKAGRDMFAAAVTQFIAVPPGAICDADGTWRGEEKS